MDQESFNPDEERGSEEEAYQHRLPVSDSSRERASYEEKKRRNTEAQKRLRAYKKKWDNFPEAFKHTFASSDEARNILTKAWYFDRNQPLPAERLSWKTGTPQLIQSQECFALEPPSIETLWGKIMDNIDATSAVRIVQNNEDGSQSSVEGTWNKVMVTLLTEISRDPDSPSQVSAIVDIPLAAPDIQLRLPERFGRVISTPELLDRYTANIGFSNQWFPFHEDVGYASLVALAPGCEKLWLLAPAEEENLQLLKEGELTTLELVESLQDLVVMRQTPDDVMFLPPSIIHATFTIKTGILFGSMFRTRQNIFSATLSLIYVMGDPSTSSSEQNDIIQTWIRTLTAIAQASIPEEIEETYYALKRKGLKKLRRTGAFGDLGLEVEEVIAQHFPRARLRPVDKVVT